MDLLDFIEDTDTSALAGLVVTDAERRRRGLGPDLGLMEDVAGSADCPVFAAGGIESLGQLRALADRDMAGAIVGRAFTTGSLNPIAVAEEFG